MARYEEGFRSTAIGLGNPSRLYARFTTSVICNDIIQNSSKACGVAPQKAPPPLCADSCVCMEMGILIHPSPILTFKPTEQYQYAQSEQNIILDPEVGGTPRSDYHTLLESDYKSCAEHARSALTCLDAYDNESKGATSQQHGGNCGFGSNIDELCRYCNSGSKASTASDASCCDRADAAARCKNVVIFPPTQPPLPFPTLKDAPEAPRPSGTGQPTPGGHNEDSSDNPGNKTAESPAHARKDAVAGIIIGCIAAALLVLFALFFLWRRKKQQKRNEALEEASPAAPRIQDYLNSRNNYEQDILSTDAVVGSVGPPPPSPTPAAGIGPGGAAVRTYYPPRFQRARDFIAYALLLPSAFKRQRQHQRGKSERGDHAPPGDIESQTKQPESSERRSRRLSPAFQSSRPPSSHQRTSPGTTHGSKGLDPGKADGRKRDSGSRSYHSYGLGTSGGVREIPSADGDPNHDRASSPMTATSMQAHVSDETDEASFANAPRPLPLPLPRRLSPDAEPRSPTVGRFPREHRRRSQARCSMPAASPPPEERTGQSNGVSGSPLAQKQKQVRISEAQNGNDREAPRQLDGEAGIEKTTRPDPGSQEDSPQTNNNAVTDPFGGSLGELSSLVSFDRPSSTNAVVNGDHSSSKPPPPRIVSHYQVRFPDGGLDNGFSHSLSEPQLQTKKGNDRLTPMPRPQSYDSGLGKKHPPHLPTPEPHSFSSRGALVAKTNGMTETGVANANADANPRPASFSLPEKAKTKSASGNSTAADGNEATSTGHPLRNTIDSQTGPLNSHPTAPGPSNDTSKLEHEKRT